MEIKDWAEYLSNNLVLPFEGVIDDAHEPWSLVQYGDKIVVTAIDGEDDKYGVIATVRIGRLRRHIPIVDIVVADTKSPNIAILDDYRNRFFDSQ